MCRAEKNRKDRERRRRAVEIKEVKEFVEAMLRNIVYVPVIDQAIVFGYYGDLMGIGVSSYIVYVLMSDEAIAHGYFILNSERLVQLLIMHGYSEKIVVNKERLVQMLNMNGFFEQYGSCMPQAMDLESFVRLPTMREYLAKCSYVYVNWITKKPLRPAIRLHVHDNQHGDRSFVHSNDIV